MVKEKKIKKCYQCKKEIKEDEKKIKVFGDYYHLTCFQIYAE